MTDDTKVVSLRGSLPTPKVEPVPGLVEMLEGLIDGARSGAIRAFGFTAWEAGVSMPISGWKYDGHVDSELALGFGIALLEHRYLHNEPKREERT